MLWVSVSWLLALSTSSNLDQIPRIRAGAGPVPGMLSFFVSHLDTECCSSCKPIRSLRIFPERTNETLCCADGLLLPPLCCLYDNAVRSGDGTGTGTFTSPTDSLTRATSETGTQKSDHVRKGGKPYPRAPRACFFSIVRAGLLLHIVRTRSAAHGNLPQVVSP